jgi:hypothetical protein
MKDESDNLKAEVERCIDKLERREDFENDTLGCHRFPMLWANHKFVDGECVQCGLKVQ